jgi:hypothetical protein
MISAMGRPVGAPGCSAYHLGTVLNAATGVLILAVVLLHVLPSISDTFPSISLYNKASRCKSQSLEGHPQDGGNGSNETHCQYLS